MLLNVVCSQLNFHFTIKQVLHLEKLGKIPGKHLKIPGNCSTNNSGHPAEGRIISSHFQQFRLSTYHNDDDDDDDDDDDELFLWYC